MAGYIVGIIGVLFWIGIAMIKDYTPKMHRIKGNKKLKKVLEKDSKEDNVFAGTHIYFSATLYNIIRYTLIGLITLVSVLSKASNGIFIAAILYFISIPKVKTQNYKIMLPFGYLINKIKKAEELKKDDELLEHLSLLKNIIVQLRSDPVSAEYIIENLRENANVTKKAYSVFITLFSLNKKAEAQERFVKEINTELARDVARLLVQLDELQPIELEEAILSRQNYVRETKLTRAKQRDELVSDLIYLPVIITVLLIFVNFLYVGFFSNSDMFSIFI